LPSLMSCLCCRPAECAPSQHLGAGLQLIVRGLSGSILAEVSAQADMTVEGLKIHLEEKMQLAHTTLMQSLLAGGKLLEENCTLQEAGLSHGEEIVAICSDAIMVGDFEEYSQGCPTCNYNSTLCHLSFHKDQTVSVQRYFFENGSQIYSYALGELKEGPEGLERTLELRGPKDSGDQEDVVKGTLHLHPSSAIERRVDIPDFNMNVTDLRFLKQQGREMSQQRMAAFLEHMQEMELRRLLPRRGDYFDTSELRAEEYVDAEEVFKPAWRLRKRKGKGKASRARDPRRSQTRALAPEPMEKGLLQKHAARKRRIRQLEHQLKWL